MQLYYGLLPKRSDPPRNFGTFGHFSFGYFFPKLLGHFFVIFHQKFKKKVPQNFWIWSTLPPFLPKIPKLSGHKKVPQNFGIGSETPPPPLWKILKLKLNFFRSVPNFKVFAWLLLWGPVEIRISLKRHRWICMICRQWLTKLYFVFQNCASKRVLFFCL